MITSNYKSKLLMDKIPGKSFLNCQFIYSESHSAKFRKLLCKNQKPQTLVAQNMSKMSQRWLYMAEGALNTNIDLQQSTQKILSLFSFKWL